MITVGMQLSIKTQLPPREEAAVCVRTDLGFWSAIFIGPYFSELMSLYSNPSIIISAQVQGMIPNCENGGEIRSQ